MEQFTLEKYLKDPTRKVVTRNGKDVRIICTDRRSPNKTHYPIVALVSEGSETPFTYTANGELYKCERNNYDLFFAPKKQSRWVFLYKELYNKIAASVAYASKETAIDRMKHFNGFALTKITWEE